MIQSCQTEEMDTKTMRGKVFVCVFVVHSTITFVYQDHNLKEADNPFQWRTENINSKPPDSFDKNTNLIAQNTRVAGLTLP